MNVRAGLRVGKGYTIVEVLIFMAVTGMLIIAAGALINGRQEKTRFSQSADTIASTLEDVFNDVSTGFYPTDNKIACTKIGISLNITNPGGTVSQGTNTDCVFSGKLVSFTLGSTDYNTYTVVSDRDSESLSIGVHELVGIGRNAGLVESYQNTADLRVNKIFNKTAAGTEGNDYSGLLIMSDFGIQSGTNFSGNASKVRLYGRLLGTPTLNHDPLLANDFEQIPNDSQVAICLAQPNSGIDRSVMVYITPQLRVERLIGTRDNLCG